MLLLIRSRELVLRGQDEPKYSRAKSIISLCFFVDCPRFPMISHLIPCVAAWRVGLSRRTVRVAWGQGMQSTYRATVCFHHRQQARRQGPRQRAGAVPPDSRSAESARALLLPV